MTADRPGWPRGEVVDAAQHGQQECRGQSGDGLRFWPDDQVGKPRKVERGVTVSSAERLSAARPVAISVRAVTSAGSAPAPRHSSGNRPKASRAVYALYHVGCHLTVVNRRP
jgi:hypothetical protein